MQEKKLFFVSRSIEKFFGAVLKNFSEKSFFLELRRGKE